MAQGFFFFFQFKINKKIANHKLDELTFKGEHRQDNYGRTKRGEQKFRGCLVCVFKQPFSVFKQHYTYFHTFFHPRVFSKKAENCCLSACTKARESAILIVSLHCSSNN